MADVAPIRPTASVASQQQNAAKQEAYAARRRDHTAQFLPTQNQRDEARAVVPATMPQEAAKQPRQGIDIVEGLRRARL